MKNFLSDDLRETHRADSVTRVMNRHHTVDPNAYMLIASLKYTPKDQKNNIAQRECKSFDQSSLCFFSRMFI